MPQSVISSAWGHSNIAAIRITWGKRILAFRNHLLPRHGGVAAQEAESGGRRNPEPGVWGQCGQHSEKPSSRLTQDWRKGSSGGGTQPQCFLRCLRYIPYTAMFENHRPEGTSHGPPGKRCHSQCYLPASWLSRSLFSLLLLIWFLTHFTLQLLFPPHFFGHNL